MNRLTKRQREVLRAIHTYRARHGYAPTIRELGDELGIKSTNGVADHLRFIEQKGCIDRVARASRTITLTERGLREIGETLS